MPLVRVLYKPMGSRILSRLGPNIAEAVASYLSCTDEGGGLAREDVEVMFDPASEFDVSEFDLLIDVEAKHFPRRDKGDASTGEAPFAERVQSLGEHLRQVTIPGHLSFGLWVKLNNAQWFGAEATSKQAFGDMMENPPAEVFPGHFVAHGLD